MKRGTANFLPVLSETILRESIKFEYLREKIDVYKKG